MTLAEIATLVKGTVRGNPRRAVVRVAAPGDAAADALCVVWQPRLIASVAAEAPLLVPPGRLPQGRDGIEVEDPRGALVALLAAFSPPRAFEAGVHPSAVVDTTALVDPSATVGPLCVVGPHARIGAHAVLEGQVYAGRNVAVGEGSRIEPQVVLHDDTVIGARVVVHAGTAIGCDGFGFVPDGSGGHRRIPQTGRVVIEDDCEIGALCTIDRATIGETRIGAGTKTDNHVHVGHNCRVGRNCLIVAFTGLAGSTELGDGVTMASRTGTVPHARIGRGAVIGGMAGVTTDVPDGAFWSGFPAQEHKAELRMQALVRRLPDLYARLKALEARTSPTPRSAGES
jgi:UDP-3-O-[3-hydroxymyristoyl] glucosamine N-acyltransferase